MLHLEFQTDDEQDMIYRKAEYHGIALNLKKMEIRHIVVYLGINKPTMPTQLLEKEVFRGFDLIDIHALSYEKLLQSQVPDVVLLTALADYPIEQAESILRLIVRRLRTVCQNPSELSKYLKQLVIVARLRKIEGLTIKITEEMPITYDIETDYLYKRGIEQGIETGVERGVVQGIEKEKIEVVCNARREGVPIELIARIVKLTPQQVKEVLIKFKID